MNTIRRYVIFEASGMIYTYMSEFESIHEALKRLEEMREMNPGLIFELFERVL